MLMLHPASQWSDMKYLIVRVSKLINELSHSELIKRLNLFCKPHLCYSEIKKKKKERKKEKEARSEKMYYRERVVKRKGMGKRRDEKRIAFTAGNI